MTDFRAAELLQHSCARESKAPQPPRSEPTHPGRRRGRSRGCESLSVRERRREGGTGYPQGRRQGAHTGDTDTRDINVAIYVEQSVEVLTIHTEVRLYLSSGAAQGWDGGAGEAAAAHFLHATSFCAQGDTDKELTDCTRSVTFRMSCARAASKLVRIAAVLVWTLSINASSNVAAAVSMAVLVDNVWQLHSAVVLHVPRDYNSFGYTCKYHDKQSADGRNHMVGLQDKMRINQHALVWVDGRQYNLKAICAYYSLWEAKEAPVHEGGGMSGTHHMKS